VSPTHGGSRVHPGRHHEKKKRHSNLCGILLRILGVLSSPGKFVQNAAIWPKSGHERLLRGALRTFPTDRQYLDMCAISCCLSHLRGIRYPLIDRSCWAGIPVRLWPIRGQRHRRTRPASSYIGAPGRHRPPGRGPCSGANSRSRSSLLRPQQGGQPGRAVDADVETVCHHGAREVACEFLQVSGIIVQRSRRGFEERLFDRGNDRVGDRSHDRPMAGAWQASDRPADRPNGPS
jgi:hypothetical protein